MKLRTALELGRVSNLPTVWTNVLAGAVLAGASIDPAMLAWSALTLSSFYIGGMYLNDAFDRVFDAQHQPHRPIPSGRASARGVFAIGFGLLALGVIGVASHQTLNAMVAALSLVAVIVFYNMHHKGNPWSPVLMATCRVLVYVTSGLMLGGTITRALMLGCAALLVYLIGLTFVAKRGASGKVVGMLLAGICIVDATALLLSGQPALALVAALGFPITRALHRSVAGT